MKRAALAAILAIWPGLAGADPLGDALDLWLTGADAEALPMLDQLAEAGEPTAALVLAMIERRVPSAYLAGLDARERRAVFRKEGGKFGVPWIEVARTGPQAALADALWPSVTLDDYGPVVETLIAAGEPGHAKAAMAVLGNMDPTGLAALADRTDLPAGMDWLVWSAAVWAKQSIAQTPATARVIARAVAAPDGLDRRLFLTLGGEREPGLAGTADDRALNRLLLSGEIIAENPASPDQAAQMEAVLMAAPQLAAVRALCEAECPQGPPACLRAVYAMIGGIAAMNELTTPLQSAIRQDAYEASPRYVQDLAQLARAEPRHRIAPAPGASCAVAMIGD